MGVSADSSWGRSRGGKDFWTSMRFLTRRKVADSAGRKSDSQLAQKLTVPHLIGIGVGSTIGAGVYVLVGTVAREESGPALAISFLIAGIASALSAFCYAELASRCPSAGSAYHYSYLCLGEGAAWLIGWALILEYTVGSSTVARGLSPNLAAFFGGMDNLPVFLARHHISGTGIIVDPCAAIVTIIITGLLCVGIKESTTVQVIVTSVNLCALMFVIIVGSYLGFKSGWTGYELPSGYFPFGFNGVLAGSATVFFAYIGFDAVASTAEEVKNPQRDLPLGIGVALFLCCALYMVISVVIVGLVPYYAIDPDTPISSAFAKHGVQWAAYIINAGASTALCSSLMGGMLPQPRILMAMARDGLLPPFFSSINKRCQVPVNSTIVTGLVAAIMAALMDVDSLAGMVSVGTLLAFTMVSVSVLILRYIPPGDAPSSSSIEESSSSVSPNIGSSKDKKHFKIGLDKRNRRTILRWTLTLTCVGVIILTSAASASNSLRAVRFTFCGVGALLVLAGLVFLTFVNQDDARHSFGFSGGFLCPWVPLLPIVSILVNCYLLINLGRDTWVRVSVWIAVGVLIYAFYGRSHSALNNVLKPGSNNDHVEVVVLGSTR